MKTKFLVSSVAVLFVLVGAGCNNNSVPSDLKPTESQPAVLAPTASAPVSQTASLATNSTVAVSISNYSFSQPTLTVKKGDTVVWTNDDPMPHTIVADSGAFKSDNLSTGQTFSYTFNQAGTFDYHCSIHPSMKGSITVSE